MSMSLWDRANACHKGDAGHGVFMKHQSNLNHVSHMGHLDHASQEGHVGHADHVHRCPQRRLWVQ